MAKQNILFFYKKTDQLKLIGDLSKFSEREREREREQERHRERDRQTDRALRERERETDRQTDRQTDRAFIVYLVESSCSCEDDMGVFHLHNPLSQSHQVSPDTYSSTCHLQHKYTIQ